MAAFAHSADLYDQPNGDGSRRHGGYPTKVTEAVRANRPDEGAEDNQGKDTE